MKLSGHSLPRNRLLVPREKASQLLQSVGIFFLWSCPADDVNCDRYSEWGMRCWSVLGRECPSWVKVSLDVSPHGSLARLQASYVKSGFQKMSHLRRVLLYFILFHFVFQDYCRAECSARQYIPGETLLCFGAGGLI